MKDEAEVDVNISIAPNSLKIAPFILSTFVENSFKHLSVDNKWISVIIHFKENQLYMNVQNSYESKVDNQKSQQGIGLAQVKKRLLLIYPDQHTLELAVKDDVFSVILKIKFI